MGLRSRASHGRADTVFVMRLAPALQAWIDARQRHRLSHAQVQMARELGMNPTSLGALDAQAQEPWKVPLPVFIEQRYQKQFGRAGPHGGPVDRGACAAASGEDRREEGSQSPAPHGHRAQAVSGSSPLGGAALRAFVVEPTGGARSRGPRYARSPRAMMGANSAGGQR